MTFEILIMFVLSTIGMTHIIVDSSIMEPFRNFLKSFTTRLKIPKFGEVVDCYLCTGVWCGFLMGLIFISSNIFVIFACGCAGGFLSNLAAALLNLIEAKTIINFPEDKHEH